MSKRRTAEDALNMPSNVRQFIAQGRPSAQKGHAVPDQQSEASDSDDTNDELQDAEPNGGRPSRKPRRSAKQRSRPNHSEHDLARTYAKATVQKTVRFQPKLIADWEAHVRTLEDAGQTSKPFQQMQNEALELWLRKYARVE